MKPIKSKKPFFISVPHSGEEIPKEAPWLQGLEEPLIMCDADRFVDLLYKPAMEELHITHVLTQWHRYAVDLNRHPDDIDSDSVTGAPHKSGSFTTGLHWSQTTRGQKLMKKPISKELHQRIVQNYYWPFHHKIQNCYAQLKAQNHTKVYQLDAHSMPSMGTSAHRDPGQGRAQVVVSDVDGTSCEPNYTELVVHAYKKAGFEVATNWPYKGGRITQIYGHPTKGQHALQVELNRTLYMNEETKQLKPQEFKEISSMIHKALKVIHESIPIMTLIMGVVWAILLFTTILSMWTWPTLVQAAAQSTFQRTAKNTIQKTVLSTVQKIQSPESPSQSFSYNLPQLIERFLEFNPTIAAAESQEKAASWNVRWARSLTWPEISLSSQFQKSHSPLAAFGIPNLSGFARQELHTWELQWEQPIYMGGSIRSGYKVKQLDHWESKWRLVALQQKEVAQIIGDVIQLLSLQGQVDIIKKSQKTQKKFLRLTRKRYKKGIAQIYELQQAEGEALSFIPRIDQLKENHSVLLNQIKVYLNMKPHEALKVQWSLDKPHTYHHNSNANASANTNMNTNTNDKTTTPLISDFNPSQLHSMLIVAKQQRPELQQANIQIQRAREQKKVRLSETRPSLSLTALWGFKSTAFHELGDSQTNNKSFFLKAKIPLFSGFSSTYIKRASQKDIESAQKKQLQWERNIELELRESISNYTSSLYRLEQIQKWHKKAQQALQSVSQSYQLGIVGSSEIYRLQLASEQATLSFLQAKSNVRLAELKYSLAMGIDLHQRYASK